MTKYKSHNMSMLAMLHVGIMHIRMLADILMLRFCFSINKGQCCIDLYLKQFLAIVMVDVS